MNTTDFPSASMLLGLLVAAVLPALVAAYLLRRDRRIWPVVALLALLAFGFGVAFDKFLPDDSYITYRYAQNLLQGHGFVYNTSERVLSTTTPLYALILALFGLVWPDLPYTSHAVSVAALFGAALVAFLLFQRHRMAVAGLFMGVLLMFNPLTPAIFSSESILHLLLIWGAFLAYDAGKLNWAALCSGLAVVNRGDGALVALALGLHWLLVRLLDPQRRAELNPRKMPLSALGVYALAALPWYLFSWFYFGSPAPATLSAKVAQQGLPGTMTFWPGLYYWWNSYSSHSVFYWILPPLLLAGLFFVLRSAEVRVAVPLMLSGTRRILKSEAASWTLPILLWAALYALGYSLLGVPRYQNYYTPLAPVVVFLSLFGAHQLGIALVSRLSSRRITVTAPTQRITVSLASLLAGLLLASAFTQTNWGLNGRLPQARALVYEDIGRWLRANTPLTATVGALEVGTLGYYADRHIIDFYGLIQPEVSEHLAQNDQTWSIRHYQPDYVVALPWMVPVWHNVDGDIDTWFNSHYTPIKEFPYERLDPKPTVVYKLVAP